ncbi:hypothetical protein L208DRAFT_1418222, partial [Tricholoma matsutake]
STCPTCNETLHIPTINHLIHITCREGRQVAYNCTGQTWFHDGMFTGNSLLYDSQAAGSVHNDGAVMAIYTSELHTP